MRSPVLYLVEIDFFKELPFVIDKDPEVLKLSGWILNYINQLKNILNERNKQIDVATINDTQKGLDVEVVARVAETSANISVAEIINVYQLLLQLREMSLKLEQIIKRDYGNISGKKLRVQFSSVFDDMMGKLELIAKAHVPDWPPPAPETNHKIRLHGSTLADWRKVNAVNVAGTFLGCREAVRVMKETGGGSIVNLSSVAGIIGDASSLAYCASKRAVRMLTKSAALHCARAGLGIRVNSVHPSFAETPWCWRASPAPGTRARPRGPLPRRADGPHGQGGRGRLDDPLSRERRIPVHYRRGIHGRRGLDGAVTRLRRYAVNMRKRLHHGGKKRA